MLGGRRGPRPGIDPARWEASLPLIARGHLPCATGLCNQEGGHAQNERQGARRGGK